MLMLFSALQPVTVTPSPSLHLHALVLSPPEPNLQQPSGPSVPYFLSRASHPQS